MDDDFLGYFERELCFVREMGREFARKYPKVAGRLLLEPDRCEDPHVERLIESFAFICARMHKRLDDDLPEITQSLFNVLYPYYTNPIPSMTVVQFAPFLKNVPHSGYEIAEGAQIFSRAVNGTPCRFATAYPVTLWPIEVVSAALGEPGTTLHIRLKLQSGASFSSFAGDRLRFFLNGQRQHVFPLYEMLCNEVRRVECVSVGNASPLTIPLRDGCIRPVGFDEDQSLLPLPEGAFPGYRLLQEYFAFPEKFLFVDVVGLSALSGRGIGDSVDLLIHLEKPSGASLQLDAGTFCLHAAPAVNIFRKTAEPVGIDHRKTEYRVVPDLRRTDAMEVLRVEAVVAARNASYGEPRSYSPLYSVNHHDGDKEAGEVFWHTQRRFSERCGDHGTDVFLSFCDTDARPLAPAEEIVTVSVTCCNRDLPAKLPIGDPSGDFQMETAAPVQAIRSLVRPTAVLRPALGGALQWRLISHLSLNHLSLVQAASLKEILTLYDYDHSPATRQQIAGIVSVESRHVTRRLGQAFCRGVEVTVEFDEDKYVGSGLYLFASVLERFLGQYVSLNSFVQLVARSAQGKEVIKRWPPRNGDRVLI